MEGKTSQGRINKINSNDKIKEKQANKKTPSHSMVHSSCANNNMYCAKSYTCHLEACWK